MVYSGSKSLTEAIEGAPLNAGQLVLSPTRTYAPIVKSVFKEIGRDAIHGMVHCSGGAQTKILHFIDRGHVIKDDLFDVPPLFALIQNESQTSWKEMYQVFNMGHRMEFYVAQEHAAAIIDIAKSMGVAAKIVGRVAASDHKRLTIKSPHGVFEYA